MLKKTKQRNSSIGQIVPILVFSVLIVSIFIVIYIALLNNESSPKGTVTKTVKVSDHLSFSNAIPESAKKADAQYFDDTVFIGDSITYGVALYNYLSWDHVFAKIGLHQGTALNSKVVYLSKKDGYTIDEAVKMAQPGKVIITLGINAIYSCYNDSFIDNYRKLIEKVKKASPETTIIIQSVFPVSENWARQNRPDCNQRIADANDAISKLAKQMKCYYLNTYENMADENGFMLSGLVSDGLHLSKNGYDVLFDYVLSHAIESSGAFTKIGAVTPPASSNHGSTVSMPDLTVSGTDPQFEYTESDPFYEPSEGEGEDQSGLNEGDESESEGDESEGEGDESQAVNSQDNESSAVTSQRTPSQRDAVSSTVSESRNPSSATSSKRTQSTTSRRNPFFPWR